jgi:hypothetical protein
MEMRMDIKKEVQRRIADLTRFAYERGYRDGAQSALTEIESVAVDDVAVQIAKLPAPLKAIAAAKPKRAKAAKRVTRAGAKGAAKEMSKTIAKAATKSAAKPKAKRASTKPAASKKTAVSRKTAAGGARGKSKTATVREALQTLMAQKGEAKRDEVLAAAQAQDPKITRHDLNNGLRTLTKRAEIRVSPDDKSRFLPAEAAA